MSGNAVIRDADDMERFAKALDNYEEVVRNLCNTLQGRLSDADQFMRDDGSRQALIRISESLHEIVGELPDCKVLTLKITRSAGFVREASEAIRR